MLTTVLLLAVAVPSLASHVTPSDGSRSPEDHVDPWDVVTEYDFSDSRVAMGSNIPVVDKALRLAQKDIKYFKEAPKPWEGYWEDRGSGEDHLMGFNYTVWNRTYIRPPEGMGDKQTNKLMSRTVPEFDITKIKLKQDKKHNDSVIFLVSMKEGPANKIIGYSSKRLHVQIHAPKHAGAANNELARYLSKVLAVSRKCVRVKQGAGFNIRKVRIPKAAVHENVFVRKLIEEFQLEEVTESEFNA